MPPRVIKRGGAASGAKRTTRSAKRTPTHATPHVLAEDPAKVEESLEEAVVVEEEKPIKEDKPVVSEKQDREGDVKEDVEAHVANGSITGMKEDEARESAEELGRDERLDLEYNDHEYDPEEYDDREMDQEDAGDLGIGPEDAEEEHIMEEEEVVMVEEELDDPNEELEGEEEYEDERDGDDHEHEQEHGHEHPEILDIEEEHHDAFKERRKRKEFEVFIGGLDKDATEDDLRKVFSVVGEVTEVRLMMNPQTKKNKGFAFLRFATVEQARRAVTELKNPMIHGKQCGVTPSQDSDTLFLGNICKTWTKEALKEKLKHYGVENVDDVTLVEDSNNEGMNRGFAFLEFPSRSDAMVAFKRLQKRDVLFGVDRPAKVSFADSFIDPGDEIMAQVKTVFIDSLPASWDEHRVKELLKKYGHIEKIELAHNMPSAKRRDFGFVTFDTHDAAVTCAKSINNAELGDSNGKAKVRARLSRPLQRGKWRHVSHGETRSGRGSSRVMGSSWKRPPPPRSFGLRPPRSIGSRMSATSLRRPIVARDRRPVVAMPPPRPRSLPPPSRFYDRRVPVPSYPKSSMKRDYNRREDLPPPRTRVPMDYGSRIIPERRATYMDDYPSRGPGYDMHKSTHHPAPRREYPDDGYGQRYDRPPTYREGRAHDYDSMSGSKRPYSALDDIPSRYGDPSIRQSRARLDYELGGGSSHYSDTYSDRLGRSSTGYSGSRGSTSSQDSHGLYSSSRHGMGYGGSYGGSDGGGMYSSNYGSDYMSRGSNVGSGSYSSMYSSRYGGSGYTGPGGSGSYY
ncbi:hypothetical protein SAY87_022402 [Trapa incisa]|uniref:RRM domain-containing protein n=1 Tax=Trapa incisa TaxID=236973 RepID=A0AAN7Q440_9MYRT|nr:hypothetical protein SAY87_022402 [Trapa incisa]